MPRGAHNPVLWVGITLLTLGAGNWVNGYTKIAAYDAIVAQASGQQTEAPFDGFPNLTERTNRSLLRPLHSPVAIRSFAEGKREFYRVVLSGGRILTLFGLCLVVMALLWQRRRLPRQS